MLGQGQRRIYRTASVGADLDVYMRAGAISGVAHRTDDLPARHSVSNCDVHSPLVAIPDLGAVRKGHDCAVAIRSGPSRFSDDTGRYCVNGCT